MKWYDPEEDCWTDSGELFDLPYKRLRYCLATVRTEQRIFIFGGQAADEVSDEVYAIKNTVNWYQVRTSFSAASRLIFWLFVYELKFYSVFRIIAGIQ